MTESDRRPDWARQALLRLSGHLPLKVVSTSVAISVFMVIYFILLRHPFFPVTLIPLTSLDRFIGFQPWSFFPYVSLWFYISLVPMLLHARRDIELYLSSVVLLAAMGFGIFLFWPTAVPAPDIDWARYPYVAFLKSVDATGNACPSLHVAYAALTALWLDRLLRGLQAPRYMHFLSWVWCLVIAYSTLAIKQHVALDLAAGALLGAAMAAIHLYFDRPPRPAAG
jgi:membrane-associated phospholipid phosphatase